MFLILAATFIFCSYNQLQYKTAEVAVINSLKIVNFHLKFKGKYCKINMKEFILYSVGRTILIS